MENNKIKENILEQIDYKVLIFYIGFALVAGIIGSLLGGDMSFFSKLNKPILSPPAILFPIVWTILYILMGISSYMICQNKTDKKFKKRACFIYILQLLVNSLWTLFFFRLRWYLFALIWLIFLIVLVIIMIVKFYKIKPLAAYLQIPYILWLLFASYLNYYIYYLN